MQHRQIGHLQSTTMASLTQRHYSQWRPKTSSKREKLATSPTLSDHESGSSMKPRMKSRWITYQDMEVNYETPYLGMSQHERKLDIAYQHSNYCEATTWNSRSTYRRHAEAQRCDWLPSQGAWIMHWLSHLSRWPTRRRRVYISLHRSSWSSEGIPTAIEQKALNLREPICLATTSRLRCVHCHWHWMLILDTTLHWRLHLRYQWDWREKHDWIDWHCNSQRTRIVWMDSMKCIWSINPGSDSGSLLTRSLNTTAAEAQDLIRFGENQAGFLWRCMRQSQEAVCARYIAKALLMDWNWLPLPSQLACTFCQCFLITTSVKWAQPMLKTPDTSYSKRETAKPRSSIYSGQEQHLDKAQK